MRTVTCTLTFKDGKQATGRVEAKSAQAEYPIIYGGEFQRIPRRYEMGDPGDLKTLFTMSARELSAALEIQEAGLYDIWAE